MQKGTVKKGKGKERKGGQKKRKLLGSSMVSLCGMAAVKNKKEEYSRSIYQSYLVMHESCGVFVGFVGPCCRRCPLSLDVLFPFDV